MFVFRLDECTKIAIFGYLCGSKQSKSTTNAKYEIKNLTCSLDDMDGDLLPVGPVPISQA